jgi:anti-sigma-K factor RskA
VTEIDLHHLAAVYALDGLDDDERRQFEAHHASCAICQADIVAFRGALVDLAEASASLPPPDLKSRVMAEVAVTRQLPPRLTDRAEVVDLEHRRQLRRRRLTALAAVAASVLLALSVGFAAGRSGNSADRSAAHVLEQADAQLVNLAGAPGSQFRVAWSRSAGQAVVLADGLPTTPEGKAYELWLVDASGARPLQLLDSADNGTIRRVLDVTGNGTQMAVTVEPATGSTVPTEPILFSATV